MLNQCAKNQRRSKEGSALREEGISEESASKRRRRDQPCSRISVEGGNNQRAKRAKGSVRRGSAVGARFARKLAGASCG